MQKVSNFCTPHMGFTEDVSLSFYTPLVTCPSSWHMLSDRHSPVLPSTHVAHKITQREKQLQFQEFKRRQQIEKAVIKTEYNVYTTPSQNSCQQQFTAHAPPVESFVSFKPCGNDVQMIKAEPRDNFYSNCGHVMNYPNVNKNYHHVPSPVYMNPSDPPSQQHWNTMAPPNYPNVPPNVNVYNFPPSPPNSPQRLPNYPYQIYHNQVHVHEKPNASFVHSPINSLPNQYDQSQINGIPNNQPTQPIHHIPNQYFSNGYMKSNKGVKFSVRCNAPQQNPHFSQQGPNIGVFQDASNYAITTIAGQSCSMPHRFGPDERVEYDIEASIHMKIVENPRNRRGTHLKGDVDLPSIGSFLEYLNDS